MTNLTHSPVYAPFMAFGTSPSGLTLGQGKFNDTLTLGGATALSFGISGGGVIQVGNQTTIHGGDGTDDDLLITLTSAGTRPSIFLSGSAGISSDVVSDHEFRVGGTLKLFVNDTSVASSVVINAEANTALSFTQSDGSFVQTANGLTLYGGDTSGDTLTLVNNSVDGFGKITLATNGAVFIDYASGTGAYFRSAGTTTFGYENGIMYVGKSVINGGGYNFSVKSVSTSDATITTIDSLEVNDDSAVYVNATVVCVETDGSDRNMYHLEGLFYRDGAGALQQGTTTYLTTIQSEPLCDCVFDVNGNDVRVRITGVDDENWNWKSTMKFEHIRT